MLTRSTLKARICGAVALLLGAVAGPASAQVWLPPASGGNYSPPLQPAPVRPLPYSPFSFYDLLAGFRPAGLSAPQPTGHEIIPTGPNGYIYRPTWAPVPPPAMPAAPPQVNVSSVAPPANKPASIAPGAKPIVDHAPPPAPAERVPDGGGAREF